MISDKIKLINSDSILWLSKQKKIDNVLTGICDLDETNFTFDEYITFFKRIATLIFKKLDKNGYAIFIQTDRKINRTWVDKSYILTDIATKHGLKLVWHKISLNRGVGKVDLFRPTYSHMLCYTYNGTSGEAFADVIEVSEKEYKNSTPLVPAILCAEFIRKYSKSEEKTIVDPFVGRGTIGKIVKEHAPTFNFIGVDISKEQIEFTKKKLA
jgi:hypothetical protein